MTSRPFVPVPTRLLVWALALHGLAAGGGCDRQPGANAPAPAAAASAVATTPRERARSEVPQPGPAAEEFAVKLAALRHLIAEQPRASDRATYSAYLVRDDAAAKLAEALSAAPAGGDAVEGPPVVASVDSYKRKGRTIDAATGKPVKVFQVRLARPLRADSAAEVIASWQAGRLAGAAYRYRLRKEAGDWVVSGRADESESP